MCENMKLDDSGELTPRTVSDMQNSEPTGVVFLLNINTGPGEPNFTPVSYTHLDVYKRQINIYL